MITYFWYVEDSWGNKLNGVVELSGTLNKESYNRVINQLYDDICSQYVQFDRNTIQLKSLSRL